jgi:hypothetical protein
MTDIGTDPGATSTCPVCGAQNDRTSSACHACGASLVEAVDAEGTRGDLELEEVCRSVSVDGYETGMGLVEGWAQCPVCGVQFAPRGSVLEGIREARDTPTGRDSVVVLALRCPGCGTRGRLAAVPEELELEIPPVLAEPRDAAQPGATVAPGEVPWREEEKPGADADHPLGDDRRFFERLDDGDTRSLRERGSLLDEQGEDIRQYTGEPVETEEGTVLPRQQNVGPGNEAGGGEWPDPDAPPAQPKRSGR